MQDFLYLQPSPKTRSNTRPHGLGRRLTWFVIWTCSGDREPSKERDGMRPGSGALSGRNSVKQSFVEQAAARAAGAGSTFMKAIPDDDKRNVSKGPSNPNSARGRSSLQASPGTNASAPNVMQAADPTGLKRNVTIQ